MKAITGREPLPRLDRLVHDLEAAIISGDRVHQSALVVRSADALTRRWSRLPAADKPGFDQLLASLLRQVDEDARVAFAKKLMPLRRGPRLTTTELARDESLRVAGPLLEMGRSFDEAWLLDAIAAGGDAHRCVIARRPALGEALSAALIRVGSPRVAATLLANPDAVVPTEALPALMRMAMVSEMVAVALSPRGDLPAVDRAKLVDLAHKRAQASLAHDGFTDADVVLALLSNVARAFATPVAAERMTRFTGTASIADDVFGTGPVVSARIERWIELRRIEDVLAALARDAGLPVAVLVACYDAAKPTALAAVLCGLGHPWAILKGLLRARYAGSPAPDVMSEAYCLQTQLSRLSACRLARYAASRLGMSAFRPVADAFDPITEPVAA